MLERFKARLFLSALLIGTAAGSITNVGASSTYSGYLLFAHCDNNYTNTHCKQTGTQNITNKVTAFSGTDKANFWAVGVVGGEAVRISSVHSQTLNSYHTISFDRGYYLPQGEIVQMGMENGYYVNTTATVGGTVDFK